MFQLISQTQEKMILQLINDLKNKEILEIVSDLKRLIMQVQQDIPPKKKISYGRYNIIKKMGFFIYPLLVEQNIDIPEFVFKIFNNPEHDQFVRSLSIQIISIYAAETGDLNAVLKFFEDAASDEHFETRECSQGFVRKLIKKYPDKMREWFLKMVKSKDPRQRRFSSESLRPVADNNWLKKNPSFPLSILKHLYTESEKYPRTSVGNNLSDWMRVDKTETLKIVKKLVVNGNKNSYWGEYLAVPAL